MTMKPNEVHDFVQDLGHNTMFHVDFVTKDKERRAYYAFLHPAYDVSSDKEYVVIDTTEGTKSFSKSRVLAMFTVNQNN